LGEIWADLRQWLKTDINAEDSKVKQRIAHAGQWFGETLIADDCARLQMAGPALALVYLICGIFSFFILRALGELVLHRPSSGSFV
ncbi:hypothetical protein ONO39_26170, partial [Salmonella enterica subsp. enterica serovar Anatum]|nr:hypothetical protein [Salmonella enterica subsp. enterica serovar Anatum]